MGVACELDAGGGVSGVVSDCMGVRLVEVGALGCEIWKRGSEGRWGKMGQFFIFYFLFFIFIFYQTRPKSWPKHGRLGKKTTS